MIKRSRQIGGFLTKKEATLERQKVQAQLFNHEYVDFPSVSVKEFYDFYLYHHMAKEKQCSYSTFMSYRNVIYNYIIPRIGKRKLQSIRRDDIMSVLSSIESKNVLRIAQGVISGSFKYAKAKQIIVYNHSQQQSEITNNAFEWLRNYKPLQMCKHKLHHLLQALIVFRKYVNYYRLRKNRNPFFSCLC